MRGRCRRFSPPDEAQGHRFRERARIRAACGQLVAVGPEPMFAKRGRFAIAGASLKQWAGATDVAGKSISSCFAMGSSKNPRDVPRTVSSPSSPLPVASFLYFGTLGKHPTRASG